MTYGTLTLTITSPIQSFAEPLTLAEAKAYLALPECSPINVEQDAMISSLIGAAREEAERLQGRDLVEKQWDLRLDAFPAGAIQLREPLISVDAISYTDANEVVSVLVENTDYIVDTARALVLPIGSWPAFSPRPSSAVLVRFTSGAAPAEIVKSGMKFLISGWYTNRLPFGIAYEVPFGVRNCLSHGARELLA